MKRWWGIALVVPLVLGMGTPSPAALAGSGSGARVSRPVLHRVVWDDFRGGRHGVHLRVAHRDGTHAHALYTSHRGFITEVTLDRHGRRAAFSPCCRDSLPRLVVVGLQDGRVQHPLSGHPQFYAVGGIGWSPHGSRLVFEGYRSHGGRLFDSLWSVHPDGSGLHRLLRLPSPSATGGWVDDALAWTRNGVLYTDGHDLRLAHHGRSRVLLRGMYSVHISGDGRHIVTERLNRTTERGSIWYADSDGRHARRIWLGPRPNSPGPQYGYPVLDFDGRRVLVSRSSDPTSPDDGIVSWPTTTGPVRLHPMRFMTHAFAFAWN